MPLYDPTALHQDGSDPLTGNWNVGNYDINDIEDLYATGKGRFDGGVGVGIDPVSTIPIRIRLTQVGSISIDLENLGAGDSQIWLKAGSEWSIGVDNSDANSLKFSQDADLGVNTRFAMTLAGDITSGVYNGVTIYGLDPQVEISANAGADWWSSDGVNYIIGQADGYILSGGTSRRHLTVTGGDWTIDQSVASGAAPTFGADNLSDGGSNAIITTTQETNFEAAYGWGDHDGLYHPVAADLNTICNVGAATDQTITAAGFTTAGNVTGDWFYTAEGFIHSGDADTACAFLTDRFYFQAGGVQFIDCQERAFPPFTSDLFTFNLNNVDMDIRFGSAGTANALTIDGGTGNVGIGANLDVVGSGAFADDVDITKATAVNLTVKTTQTLAVDTYVEANMNDVVRARLNVVGNAGTPANSYADVGTYTLHKLNIVTNGVPRMAVSAAGYVRVINRLMVGADSAPSLPFEVSADSIRIINTQSPDSDGAGTQGEIAWDADYIYVCTATNTWERTALTGGY